MSGQAVQCWALRQHVRPWNRRGHPCTPAAAAGGAAAAAACYSFGDLHALTSLELGGNSLSTLH
eukprot:SAG22_NODE_300_length_12752_cov_3.102426_10_plen_64_part_00